MQHNDMLLSLVCVCLVYYNRYTKVIESKRKERIKKSEEKKMHTERSSTTNYVLRMHRQCVLCRPCAVCHFIGQKKILRRRNIFFVCFIIVTEVLGLLRVMRSVRKLFVMLQLFSSSSFFFWLLLVDLSWCRPM